MLAEFMNERVAGHRERLVEEALAAVYDLELGLDVASLGFINGVGDEGRRVVGQVTLTAPGCPLAESLPAKVFPAGADGPVGGAQLDLALVWDPPWTPERWGSVGGSGRG